jgi:hypothetical protein
MLKIGFDRKKAIKQDHQKDKNLIRICITTTKNDFSSAKNENGGTCFIQFYKRD